MSDDQEFILKYLQMISSYGNNNRAEKLTLKYGQPFATPAQARPVGMKKMKDHECFRNAYLASMEHGWQYVEGFAMTIVPLHHGWCVDRDGNVIETTWASPGTAYYGIAIPHPILDAALVEQKYYGVLCPADRKSTSKVISAHYPLD